MNIAYSLQQLRDNVLPFVMVGRTLDTDYLHHIEAIGVDQRGIINVYEWPQSSHGFIFTDREGNQFTSFYAGPATVPDYRHRLNLFLDEYGNEIRFAVLAPDGPRNMIDAAQLLNERSIPFMTDPGQGLSDFTSEECCELIRESRIVLVNQFEHEFLERNVGNLAMQLDALITTYGRDGVQWVEHGETGCERAVVPQKVVDPTGCGDAFRAGFVHAHLAAAPLRDCARCGTLTASINIEHKGCQSHSLEQFAKRYLAEWDEAPAWLEDSEVRI